MLEWLRWHFEVQGMGDSHWVSVARGPVEDIVDAWQAFTNTFCLAHPTQEQYRVCSQQPLCVA